MADNNSTNNNRNRNVTGQYRAPVTGSYKPQGAYPKQTPVSSDTVFFDPARRSPQQPNNTEKTQQMPKVQPQSKPAQTPKAQPQNDKPAQTPKAQPKVSAPRKQAPEPKASAPKKRSEKIRKESSGGNGNRFDWKLLFSSENMSGFWKQVRYYGIIVVVSLLLTMGIVSVSNDVFAFIKPDESVIVSVPQGLSTKQVAKELKKSGVIEHPTVFRLYCKLKKADGKFQYGEYNLNSNYSYDVIISKLKKTSLQAETVKVTIPVGATQDDICDILTAGKYTNILDLEHALNNYEYEEFDFVKDLPERRCRLEGYLPAGEYEFYKGESAVSIVSKMLARFQETMLTEQNLASIKATGKTLDTLVTTASLVQSECNSVSDYKKAASVINNRLASQTDNYLKLTCTINYVLPNEKTSFNENDKRTDSTYNTYLNAGLPTGPVCTPSAEAFDAVISPEATAYMYFISDGEKTTFSQTSEEHESALSKASDTAKGTDTIK